MAIKAIIFDCFGVLVEDSIDKFYQTYLHDRPEVVEQIKALDHLSTEGRISFDEFLAQAAELAGVSLDETKNFLELNPNNDQLISYIRTELKPHYKIGFLSNAADNWLDDLFSKEDQAIFNDFILSFEHGIRKPSPEIFKLSASRLEVEPSESLFVDDVTEYCDGARGVGMTAIQYRDFNQFTRELKTLL